MKYTISKLMLLLSFLLFQQKELTAQEQNMPVRKFGFKIGLNSTHTNFKRGYLLPPSLPYQSERRTGLTLGFLLNVPLAKDLLIQPEYLYSLRRSFVKSTEVSYQLDYLSLPVLLRYRIHPRLSLLAGPQFDLLIKGKERGSGGTRNITHDTEERNLGATAGLELQVARSLFLEGRYMHGLSHVGIGQRSSVVEFKYEVVELTAGIRF
jgi:hypothetical protein